jgi:hypothetical protein
MNDSRLRGPKPDPEMAAFITRFEEAYAELEPEPQTGLRAKTVVESMFSHGDFEFPPEPTAPKLYDPDLDTEADESHKHAAVEARKKPAVGDNAPADDVESAFEILRGGEREASARAEARRRRVLRRAVRNAALLSNAPEPRPKSFTRFAVPGAAVAVFAVVLGGYVIARHGEMRSNTAVISNAAAANAVAAIAASQLRLDYDLKKPRARVRAAQNRGR